MIQYPCQVYKRNLESIYYNVHDWYKDVQWNTLIKTTKWCNMITEKLIHTKNTCPVSIIRCKFNVDESNRIMLHVAWRHKPRSLHKPVKMCVHCTHRIKGKATDDKITLIDRKMSLVVRYRANTRQIWQATELKSGDKSPQTIMDRPTSKEVTHLVHQLVTSATFT